MVILAYLHVGTGTIDSRSYNEVETIVTGDGDNKRHWEV